MTLKSAPVTLLSEISRSPSLTICSATRSFACCWLLTINGAHIAMGTPYVINVIVTIDKHLVYIPEPAS